MVIALKKCAFVGLGRTVRDILHNNIMAEAIVRAEGALKKEKITHGWWNRPLQRFLTQEGCQYNKWMQSPMILFDSLMIWWNSHQQRSSEW